VIVSTRACAAATDLADERLNDTMCYGNAVGNLTNLLIFAENYNVLRVMSGMGGLAYSNVSHPAACLLCVPLRPSTYPSPPTPTPLCSDRGRLRYHVQLEYTTPV